MEDDVGIARIALELEQKEIVRSHADCRKINRDALPALRTAHLLLDASNNLLEGVGIHFHRVYSTTNTSKREHFPGILAVTGVRPASHSVVGSERCVSVWNTRHIWM